MIHYFFPDSILAASFGEISIFLIRMQLYVKSLVYILPVGMPLFRIHLATIHP